MAEKVDFSELQLQQRLGAGATAVVRKAKWRGKEIAVKTYDIGHAKTKKFAEREITQLSRISHENVIKTHGVVQSGDGHTYLLMEFLGGGSLHELIYGKDQRKYSVEDAVHWAQQCAKALGHVHSMKIVNVDLKPQNMLLSKELKKLKICDFGTATNLATYLTNNSGTAAYMAPEVYRGRKYTEKCDVYSFGIVLWELMARKLPFSHLKNYTPFVVQGAAERGNRPPLDAVRSDCWEGIKHLIQRCWDKDPARRPSAS